MIELLDRAARSVGAIADVHVKIDTGMRRLGVQFYEVPEVCVALKSFPNLRVAGLITHFAAADEHNREDFTKEQLKQFQQTVSLFRERGFNPSLIHAANSAATFAFPESRDDLVRPGGALYGLVRDAFPYDISPPPLWPAVSLHSRITLLTKD